MYKCGLQKYTQTQSLFFLSLRARLFLVNFNLTFDFLNCSEHSAISDNNIILLHGKEHGKTYASNLQNRVILKWWNIPYFFSIKIHLTNLIQISLKRYFRKLWIDFLFHLSSVKVENYIIMKISCYSEWRKQAIKIAKQCKE